MCREYAFSSDLLCTFIDRAVRRYYLQFRDYLNPEVCGPLNIDLVNIMLFFQWPLENLLTS